MISYEISTLIWGKYNVYCHAELDSAFIETDSGSMLGI